jgi:2-keto-4-pentenoate hydratase/2-oxohepta-3-ene-1,7-dioic acid hydratase in catechol pathway
MKYITFSTPDDARPRIGALSDESVIDLERAAGSQWPGTFPPSLLGLIQSGPDSWKRTNDIVAEALAGKPPQATYSLDSIRWRAPIPRPLKNIFCLGLNYVAHLKESSAARGREAKIPEVPVFFSKTPTTVTGPFDPVPWDRQVTQQVDYEAELGVIIGLGGKNIPRAESLAHIFGYTIVNDFSARDVQFSHMQWFKGKSLDGFCPMGPSIVTADEFGNPQDKRITLRVNGEQRQGATTADMIFPVNAIIEWLSKGMTIEPGDIIATGTPEGVGLGRTPPLYLKDGDLVETEIEGIGMLRNRIQAS